MRVAILHNAVSVGAAAHDADVEYQVDAVEQALLALGHHCQRKPCTLDLAELTDWLRTERPDVVFNLVEGLDGTDQLIGMVPLLLEALNIRYTGASARALVMAVDKPSVKRHLRSCGIATPDWFGAGIQHPSTPASSVAKGRFILKARTEHASIGLSDDAVVNVEQVSQLHSALERREAALGQTLFAERYVAGREFNLALIEECAGQPRVLPPAEIDFSMFPEGKPRIVGYAAKWVSDSFEYQSTPRRFDFAGTDEALLSVLCARAVDSWRALRMRGYARVDFRVDDQGVAWVLEVNPNPCLSPDAGFVAALRRADLDLSWAVAVLLDRALSREADDF